MAAARGKLCVSVIEARNVVGDDSPDQKFYVRVRIGRNTAKTEPASSGSGSPKFLKDLRLDVADAASEALQVELLQQGPFGDLVIGKEQVQVVSVVDKGTIVCWLPLLAMDGRCAAELCLVMRFLQANANRPMSPSYAVAARDAKQRAVDKASPGMLDATGQPLGLSKSLFSDLGAPGSPDTPTKSASAKDTVPAWPGAANGASAAAQPPILLNTNSPDTKLKNQLKAQLQPQAHAPQRSAAPSRKQWRGQRLVKTVLRMLGNARTSLMRKKGRVVGQANKSPQLPVHAAAMCGAAVGLLFYLLKLRGSAHEEQLDGDALCAVGACFRQEALDRYRRKYTSSISF